jgi:hypothetical protein
MSLPGLELEDHLAVQRLKYLRQRSMRNAGWRDADLLGRLIRRRYLRWADDSPLEDHRRKVERALAALPGCSEERGRRRGLTLAASALVGG